MKRRRRISKALWYLMSAAVLFAVVAERMHSSRLLRAVDPLPTYNTLVKWNQ